MQTSRSWAGLVVVIAAAAIGGAFVACSDFSPPSAAGSSAFAVNPKTAHLNVGGTLQLSARGSSGAVTWSSSDETIATVSFGKVTAVGSGAATIRAVSGGGQASARISVTKAAAIALSSSNITFSGIPAGPLPDSQTVAVTNGGEDPLTGLQVGGVTYGAGATGWLDARLTQTDAPSTLVLRPNTTTLTPGSYTATVSITSAVTSQPQQVTVTFTLIHPAVIAFGSSTATFTAQQGAAVPNQQSIEITNTGDAPLTGLSVGSIGYSAGAANWLTASINPTTAPALLTLQPNTTAPAAGTYTATVTVVSSAPGVTPASVTVTYNVTPAPLPPTIEVSPTSLTFIAGRNFPTLPALKQVTITSGGAGTVSGLAASVIYGAGASNWLTTSFVGSTTAPTTLNVQPNTTSLAAGVYTATIHLTSTTSGVAAKDIPLTYVVNDLALDQSSIQFYTKSASTPVAQVVNVSNAGSGSISGVTTTVTLQSGPAAPSYAWLQSSIGSTVPQSPSATALTLTIAHADSIGNFTAVVTISAPGMVSKSLNVSFVRQATMLGDIWPILHDSTFLTSSGGSGKCAGCHSAITASDSSIDFSTSDQAYGSLVSPTFNGKTYFNTAADSTANFLYKILSGTAAASGPPNMPFSCTNSDSLCVHPGLRTRIYIWILQGALRQ